MKALTLWQPWGSFHVAGPTRPKENETRPRRTHHRGLLAIHAAKREPSWVREQFLAPGPKRFLLERYLRENAGGQFYVDDVFDSLPRGCLLGTVEVTDCVPVPGVVTEDTDEYELGDYRPGRFVIETRRPRRLVTPIEYRGRQGFWTLPDDALRDAVFHPEGLPETARTEGLRAAIRRGQPGLFDAPLHQESP